MRHITIKDIARESGYSVGTVSRAINGSGSVSPQAREAIFSVVRRYGYETNPNAKHLRQKNGTGTVIVICGPSNRFLCDLAAMIQKDLEKDGFDASCSFVMDGEDKAAEVRRILSAKTPAGLVILGADLRSLASVLPSISIPCVLTGNSAENLPQSNVGSVCIDDAAASQEAAEFLLASGHENIGVMGGDISEERVVANRYHGVQYAFYSRGLAFSYDRQYEQCTFTLEGGYAGFMHLYEKMPEIDAVFCMGDIMAMGVLRAAADLGLQVPGDLSVLGFDGQRIGDYTRPRLTTISQDMEALSRKTARILEEMLEDPGFGREPKRIHVPWKLYLRQSSRIPEEFEQEAEIAAGSQEEE